MTESPLSSAGLDERRKRALFRSRHRGMREMDVVFGAFADACLPTLSVGDLQDFENLMDAPDADVFAWLTGAVPAPVSYDTPLFRKIADFHRHAGPLAL